MSTDGGDANIKVYVRVRPSIKGEVDVGGFRAETEHGSICLQKGRKEYQSQYDAVLDPTCSQEGVFNELGDYVGRVIDGYNCSVLAYGQVCTCFVVVVVVVLVVVVVVVLIMVCIRLAPARHTP
jgi:hypothetical protein